MSSSEHQTEHPRSPHFRCRQCGVPLKPQEARMAVACRRHHPPEGTVKFAIVHNDPKDRGPAGAFLQRFWGEADFECFDRTFALEECDVYVARITKDDRWAGVLTTSRQEDTGLLIALCVDPHVQGAGIANALIRAALDHFRAQGLKKASVSTSNDDLPALYLYQRVGFRLSAVCPGVIERHHGAVLPGFAELPIRDEIRLELTL